VPPPMLFKRESWLLPKTSLQQEAVLASVWWRHLQHQQHQQLYHNAYRLPSCLIL